MLKHPPLAFWLSAAVLLVGALVFLRAPAPDQQLGNQATTLAGISEILMAEVTNNPPGSSPTEARAWLESIRDYAVQGAEEAAVAGDAAEMRIWSALLREVTAAMEPNLSARQIAERSSSVTVSIYSLATHYRMR